MLDHGKSVAIKEVTITQHAGGKLANGYADAEQLNFKLREKMLL